VPASGNNSATGNNRSMSFKYPNYAIVVSGTWRACNDRNFNVDMCTEQVLKKGVYNLCTTRTVYIEASLKTYAQTKLCEKTAYIKSV